MCIIPECVYTQWLYLQNSQWKQTLQRLNGILQFCWQVRRGVILAFDDLIAFIQSLENSEGVSDAVEGSKVFGQQFSCWWSGGTADQPRQLLHQLLLLLLHVHLPFKNTHHTVTNCCRWKPLRKTTPKSDYSPYLLPQALYPRSGATRRWRQASLLQWSGPGHLHWAADCEPAPWRGPFNTVLYTLASAMISLVSRCLYSNSFTQSDYHRESIITALGLLKSRHLTSLQWLY